MSEVVASGDVIVIQFAELMRCVRCRRLVTPRRSLREGRCLCGGIKVLHCGMITEDDIREIERDYGWDNVIIEGGREGIDYAPGLLESGRSAPAYDGKGSARALDEARFHSRNAKQRGAEADSARRILTLKRWWADLPKFLRGRERIADALRFRGS